MPKPVNTKKAMRKACKSCSGKYLPAGSQALELEHQVYTGGLRNTPYQKETLHSGSEGVVFLTSLLGECCLPNQLYPHVCPFYRRASNSKGWLIVSQSTLRHAQLPSWQLVMQILNSHEIWNISFKDPLPPPTLLPVLPWWKARRTYSQRKVSDGLGPVSVDVTSAACSSPFGRCSADH